MEKKKFIQFNDKIQHLYIILMEVLFVKSKCNFFFIPTLDEWKKNSFIIKMNIYIHFYIYFSKFIGTTFILQLNFWGEKTFYHPKFEL